MAEDYEEIKAKLKDVMVEFILASGDIGNDIQSIDNDIAEIMDDACSIAGM